MVTRRKLLQAMGVAGAGALAPSGLLRAGAAWADLEALADGVSYDPVPFTLGVASGYPTPDSVILWTRVAEDPLAADGGETGPVDVRWAIGTDPDAVGATLAGGGGTSVTAVAGSGHSVHVEATGLSPSTTYHYGFAARGVVSTIGRTRTAPVGATSQVRFAVASCQRFGSGWYAAYRHIADEDLDFVLHVGDYIYESSGSGPVRSNGVGTPRSLAEYRVRYALYKGDPDLRRAHAMHPWIVTWDDHEVFNDYIGTEVDPQRRANAYQAYYEHLPIRLTEAGGPSASSFRIHQQVQFGDLLDLAVLDTRQYRAPYRDTVDDGDAWFPEHPRNTMLGGEQKAWLKDVLAASTTAWRALGNATPFAHALQVGGLPHEVNEVFNHDALVDAGAGYVDKAHFNLDLWDGYMQERYELLEFIHEQTAGDVVSLSGDQHRNIWQHVRLDLDNPLSPIVLPEFAGPSISSGSTGSGEEGRLAVYAHAPHIRYFDEIIWGYLVCDVTPARWRTTARNLRHSQDPTRNPNVDVNATVFDAAVFEVLRGDSRMHHVSGENTNPIPDN